MFLKLFSRVQTLLTESTVLLSDRDPTAKPRQWWSAPRRCAQRQTLEAFVLIGVGGLGLGLMSAPPASAMHEIDHRFTVEGHVCDEAGRPVPDLQVIVKDSRLPDGATGFTDQNGFYTTTLHLHNDNLGDRIVVAAGKQEQTTTAKFDTTDVHTERKAVVNLGSGCEHLGSESRLWVYYSLAVGFVAVAVLAGTSYWKKQQRMRKRTKGQRR